MKRFLLITIFIIPFIFLIGCASEISKNNEIKLPETDKKDEPSKDDLSDDEKEINETKENDTLCTPKWGCLSSKIKAYQGEDCNWTKRQDCELGCNKGECKEPPTCEPGFKCRGQYGAGFQNAACEWVNSKKCEYGCKDAECLPKPNQTDVKKEEVKEEVKKVEYPSLSFGEEVIIENYTLKLHIIEADRVRLNFDGKRSDWLYEGGNYTPKGIKITIREVLFQSFPGGKQEIRYSVG